MKTGTAIVVLAGAGGVYWFVVRPELERRRLRAIMEREALAYQAAHGGSLSDAFQAIAAKACQAYAATYGAPPGGTQAACAALAKLAAVSLQYAAKGALAAGKAIGKGAKVVVKDVGKGVKATAHVVTGGAKLVGKTASKLKFWGLEDLETYAAVARAGQALRQRPLAGRRVKRRPAGIWKALSGH